MADKQGPFERFYEAATGGHGLFGRLGLKEERSMTDELIARVNANEDLAGLAPLADLGNQPMTREQHGAFRAELSQAALNIEDANRGYTSFVAGQSRLRANAVGPDDDATLGVMDDQAAYANRLMHSGDPKNVAEGVATMTSLREKQLAFSSVNEQQRLQVETAAATGRDDRRQEYQTLLNANVFAPQIESRVAYESINGQLEGKPGDELAPPSVITQMLEFTGSALRQSDDGNWSFRIGPLGLGDKAVPDMTYSEVRNQLNAANNARDKTLTVIAAHIGELAQKQGFGINGASVDDLLFPLATQAAKAQEAETKAPTIQDKATNFVERIANVFNAPVDANGEPIDPNEQAGLRAAEPGESVLMPYIENLLKRIPVKPKPKPPTNYVTAGGFPTNEH